MKNVLMSALLLLVLFGCKTKVYTPDECLGTEMVPRTRNLTVSEPMPDFTFVTDGGKKATLAEMSKDAVFILFKKAVPKSETRIFYNEEIEYGGIGDLAREKRCDVLITNEAVLAGIYGIELNDDASVKNSVLVVAGKDKVIQKIYRGSCEGHIVELLNSM